MKKLAPALLALLVGCSDFTAEPNTELPILSLSSASAYEGNGSDGSQLQFTLSLDKAAVNAAVDYITLEDSAVRDNDYQFGSGTIGFVDGSKEAVIGVDLIGDTSIEADEKLVLLLGNPKNLKLANNSANGNILDDDASTPLALSYEPTLEGTNAAIVFTLTMEHLVDGVSLNYETESGSALENLDYQPTSGVVQFSPGLSTETFGVQLIDDELMEGEEQFTLHLSQLNNATMEASSFVVTIVDDDVPVLQAENAEVIEGNLHEYSAMSFTLTVDNVMPGASVDYEFQSSSASAASDFVASSGSLSFDSQLTQYLSVDIYGDHIVEPNERLVLQFSNPANLLIANEDYQAAGVIVNDDVSASLSISHQPATEVDNFASSALTLTLQLDNYVEGVGVQYSSSDGSALVGKDYQAASGIWNLDFDQTSAEVTLDILGDQLPEGEQFFYLDITAVSGADYPSDQQRLTLSIEDDNDALVNLCLDSGSVLNFGQVAVGSSVSRDVELSNSCDQDLQLDSNMYQLPADFSLSPEQPSVAADASTTVQLLYNPTTSGVVQASLLGKVDIRAEAAEAANLNGYSGALVDDHNGLDLLASTYALGYSPAADELYVSGFHGNGVAVYDASNLALKQRFVQDRHGQEGLYGALWVAVNPVHDEFLVLGDSLGKAFVVYQRNRQTGLHYQSQVVEGDDWGVNVVESTAAAFNSDGSLLAVLAYNDKYTYSDDLIAVYERDSEGVYQYASRYVVGSDEDTEVENSNSKFTGSISFDKTDGKLLVAKNLQDSFAIYNIFSSQRISLAQEFQNGQNGVEHLNGPKMLALSSDNKFVYLSVSGSNAILVFEFEESGLYSLKQSVVDADALGIAWGLALSPDEDQLLAVGRGNNTITTYQRNASNGQLSKISSLEDADLEGVTNLNEPMMLAINASGDRLYLASYGGSALHSFVRDVDTGDIYFDAVLSASAAPISGLDEPIDLAFSPDGDYLYSLSERDNSVVVARAGSTNLTALLNSYQYSGEGTDTEYLLDPEQLLLNSAGDELLVLSPGQRRIGVYAADAGELSFKSAFDFDDYGDLDDYTPKYMQFSQDYSQLIALLEGGVGALLVLNYSSAGLSYASGSALVTHSQDLSAASSFIVDADSSKLYLPVPSSSDNSNGWLSVFNLDTPNGSLTHDRDIDGAANGSNGLKNPRQIIQTPDGNDLLVIGKTLDVSQDVNALSSIDTSSFSMHTQYTDISLLQDYDDTAMAVTVEASGVPKLWLYSATANKLSSSELTNIGTLTNINQFSIEESVNSGGFERGFAGVRALAFHPAANYLCSAGADSDAIGCVSW